MKPESGEVARPLHPFPHSFVFQPPPLFALCPLSANSVRVCCMLPWLFLEPDALCYLPARPTNSGCCVCGKIFFFFWEREKVGELLNSSLFSTISHAFFSQRPLAASWRLWSSTWPPWRARRPRSWMPTPGRCLNHITLSPHSITE